MAERTVAWKKRSENQLIGGRISRIDGVEKASGHAKYAADTNTPGTLYAKLLTCKHGHAKIVKLNVEPARKIDGVHAVHIFRDVGSELRWDGELVAAVAAERPELAEDGVRAIEVGYEVLPHFVDEEDFEGAKNLDAENLDADENLKPQAQAQGQIRRVKKQDERTKGNVDDAIKNPRVVVSTGYYGIHTITHMCLEPHGSHCEWKGEDELNVHLSTQNVSGTGGQFAEPLGVQKSNVTVNCEYVGGGFGSKFAADEWGLACAQMAKEAGRPVRLMLDRATEMKIAGNRPSGFAKITVAADAAGNITAWDSEHWGTNGIGGGVVSSGVVPYLFSFDNQRQNVSGIATNCAGQRAWRAPNHPQGCSLTCTAIDDLAAKLGMDSYDVFLKNLGKTKLADKYAKEMKIGARLIDWKAKWHPHGKGGGAGPVKQGLGMALHTWGGRAGGGQCTVKVHSDGTVESFGGTQDLGTGTRTVIAIVLAETFGIPLSLVKVHIGSSKYPASGASGGSTTVGGVSGPNRRAGLEALWKIFDKVAKRHNVDAASLEARDEKIWSNEEPVCSWSEAARLIGPAPLEVTGSGAKRDGLTDSQVGGVQMADVAVDTETGQVRINKMVAVQDTGLIIDLKTAESQVYGALIMAIAYALSEERIMDNKTGRFINADLVNYKLPRIGDVGELVVEMYQPDEEYARGVVGLGEPPVIPGGAAISNAVANAIGVRVPVLPLTPQRVLEALKGGPA